MPLALLLKGFHNRHVPEFNFLFCIIRKSSEPPSNLLLFVYVCVREGIFSPESQSNLCRKSFSGLPSFSTIAVLGNVIPGFGNRRKGKKKRCPLLDQRFEPIEHLVSVLVSVRYLEHVAEDGGIDDADAHLPRRRRQIGT